jgi:predicted kinase
VAGVTPPAPIVVPAGALVVLIGPSGSGKTTFAGRHFPRTHVLSSDEMRAIVADDPNDQAATEAAFELLHTALGLRLAARRTSVVDATNVERWARGRLLAIARRLGRPALAIVLDLPLELCLERNAARANPRPTATIRRQHRWMQASLSMLEAEGFDRIWRARSLDELAAVEVVAGG